MIYQKTNANDEAYLYYRAMGKIFRVVGIAESDEEANEYCARHEDVGVIGLLGNLVILAEHDGEKIRT